MGDILNFETEPLTKMVATMFAVVFVVGVAFVSFKNLYVITEINCLPYFIFGKSPRMSMATNSSGRAS